MAAAEQFGSAYKVVEGKYGGDSERFPNMTVITGEAAVLVTIHIIFSTSR